MLTENQLAEIERLANEVEEMTHDFKERASEPIEALRERESAEQRRLSSLAEDLIALIAEKTLASMPKDHDLSQGKWVREACFELPDDGEKALPRGEGVHLFGIRDRKGDTSVCSVRDADIDAVENVVVTVVLDGQRPEVQRLLRGHR